MLLRSLFRKKHAVPSDLDTALLRCLNLFDLVLLSVSGMVGSGIYVLSGVVAKNQTGPAIIIANLLAGVACLCGALCYAEFAARIPRAGSSYIFIYESIGELLAFLVGFTTVVGGVAGLAVSARVWSAYFDVVFDRRIHAFINNHTYHWPHVQAPFSHSPDLLALGITACLTMAMLVGLRNSKYLTNGLTVLNMAALLFIGVTGFLLGDKRNYQPFTPFGMQGIFRGSSLLLYSYIGFDTAAVAIEEAKNPSRTVPQATVISLLLVTSLYSLAGASLTYLIPYSAIDVDSAFANAYQQSRWPWAAYLISIAIVFSAGGNLLSGTYGTIRVLYAMSIDGLLPSTFSYVSKQRHVPIVATSLVCCVIGFLGTFFDIKDLIGFADISALLSYAGVSLGLLIERYNHRTSYRVLLTEESEEEMLELTEEKTDDRDDAQSSSIVQSDPVLTQLARTLCRSCVPRLDSYLSPKIAAVTLSILFVANTTVLAVFVTYVFAKHSAIHVLVVTGSVLIDVMIVLIFCLLRPKKHSKDLLFSCPGVPLVPLMNVAIFIFLMVLQDAHDWLGYLCVFLVSVFIYFTYSYRHSKSR